MNKQRFVGKLGIIFLLLTILVMLASSFFYENKTLYTNFVDEEDNMVASKFILSGQQLYKGIFEQHQPIPYLISSGLEKVVNPDSIFLLVKRHREFVIVWSAVWMLVVTYSFGWAGLGFIIIYELTKHFLFGNFFLAEALSIYPLVFLVGKIIFPKGDTIKLFEILVYGVCFSFLTFTLAPLWPLLLFLLLYFIRQKKLTLKEFLVFALGFLSLPAFILPFISIPGYIQDVIYFNSKYYIPLSQNQLTITSILRSFLSFLMVFVGSLEKTPILIIIRIMCLIFIAGLVFFTKKHKSFLLFTLLTTLGLANIRFIQPGLDYYRGFHLLPWYAILAFFVSYIFVTILVDRKQKIFTVISVILFLILAVSIILPNTKTLFVNRNLSDDYYIYYSRQFDMGTAISIMKKDIDTLFVYPDQSLIYWQAGVRKASRYIFFYPFMENIPFAINEVSQMFEKNPPTYFYCNCEGSKLIKYLKMYTPILKDGKATELYILNSRISIVTEKERSQLSFYKFSIPK